MNKKEKTAYIKLKMDEMFEDAKCELLYNKDYELLLAVMLSAQTTDKRVNSVTNFLFAKYDTLEKLDALSLSEIESLIKPIGMYKQKAKNFKGIVSKLIKIGGVVPNDRNVLESFPGVGRKTINVVLSNLFNEPCIAVDTHVARVSKRLGLAKDSDDVLEIENKIMSSFPKKCWAKLHHQLVLFGRYKCKAVKPQCKDCPFLHFCKEENKRI